MAQLEKSIVLTGIKHCGKSTLGKALAKYYNCPFFDTDDLITELTGKSPRQIYTESGSEGFFAAEAEACKALSEKLAGNIIPAKGSAIIATGGGICNNGQALSFLRSINCLFVFLQVPETLAADRIVAESVFENGKISNLPAYIAKKNPHTEIDVRNIFHDFYVERTASYKNIADLCVTVNSSAVEENTVLLAGLISENTDINPVV